MSQKYVIESLTETCTIIQNGKEREDKAYWSNKYGWVDIGTADIFTEEEKKDLHLPMDSRWKEYKED
jgi:hypothetical protein